MTAPVSVVMVGIGGYGVAYLDALRRLPSGAVELRGAVDPSPERAGIVEELAGCRVPVLPSLDAFFEAGVGADLAVIASPIHHHVPQSVTALAHGCHVLCEKPLGATIQETRELAAARDASDGWVRIGYQWSYSEGILALKRWGSLRRPGSAHALAHFLHNLLYLLGPTTESSAALARVTAEACRANPIESYDTAACRACTPDGVELLFYGSHASRDSWGPRFDLEFEEAREL